MVNTKQHGKIFSCNWYKWRKWQKRSYINIKNYYEELLTPFVIYVDTETILKKTCSW